MSEAELAHVREVLLAALTTLRRAAGQPTTRAIAKVADCSHTTVSDAFIGRTVPSWPMLKRIVLALDGNVEDMRPLWQAYQDARPEPSIPRRGWRHAAFKVRLALSEDCVMVVTASRRPSEVEWTAALEMLAVVADPTKARR